MIKASDVERPNDATVEALLDFFMIAADALDGGDATDLLEHYEKEIANENSPLHKLYSELCDANTF